MTRTATTAPQCADAIRAKLEAHGMTSEQAHSLAEQLQRREAIEPQARAAGHQQHAQQIAS
jgi:hypothetical protein